jgi:hypothetical protein
VADLREQLQNGFYPNAHLCRLRADRHRADPGRHPERRPAQAFHGLTLAYLGRKADAIREGERATALAPASRDGYLGTYIQHQLARIYVLTGEQDKAIDQLEQLLHVPYFLSPGWLRVDPNFAPLRKNPRFQTLAGGTA